MPRYLHELQDTRVYVEANILLFVARADPIFGSSALRFLEEAEDRQVELLTSTLTLDEVAFVALKSKLEERYGVTTGQVLFLKRNPNVVKTLTVEVEPIIANTLRLVKIVSVEATDAESMHRFMAQFGLLPRDALHLSVASRLGLQAMASNDADFDRVTWLTRYQARATTP